MILRTLTALFKPIILYLEGAYRGKLVVELWQHGVMDEDGWVSLKSLQLLHQTLFIFFAAIPGGHLLEEGLACGVASLQDHHLSDKALTMII